MSEEIIKDPVSEIEFAEDKIFILYENGRLVKAPLDWFPSLKDAKEEIRANYEIKNNGNTIFWPEAKESISSLDFLKAKSDKSR